MVFKNKYKTEGSNQPDYRIYFDNGPQKVSISTTKAEEAPKKQKALPKKEESAPKNEEIPF
jgi:hypothetical protein